MVDAFTCIAKTCFICYVVSLISSFLQGACMGMFKTTDKDGKSPICHGMDLIICGACLYAVYKSCVDE